MNRYRFLLNRQAALKKEGSDLAALETSWTDEQRKRAGEIAAELAQVETDLAIVKQLHDAERVAPAAGATGVTVHDNRADDPKHGFRNIGEFAIAVKQAQDAGRGHLSANAVDERLLLAAPTDFHKSTGSDEGRMIPPAFRNEIWEAVDNQDQSLINEVDTEPTSSNSVGIITDESTPWGSSGVQARWRSEAEQMTASKLATKEELAKLDEIFVFVLATEELLSDAPRLTARIQKKAPMALTYKLNEAIVNGTGAGTPLGWMKSGALVSVAKETGQAAATVVAANVAKMFARQINPGRAVWKVNQDVLPQLLTMTLGNNAVYALPQNGFVNAPGGFLLGRPVQFLENCETLGTKGDIQFVDPKGYYAARRQNDVDYAESIHLFFDYNIRAFRFILRILGQPYLSAPISPAKGSNTRSHFVSLDTRA